MLGLVLWMLGYPDQGRANLRQALAHAQEIEQPSSQAFSHYLAVMANSVFGHDVASAVKHTEALRRLDHASLPYAAWIELLARQALVQGRRTDDGAPNSGLEQVLGRAAEATSTWQSTGSGAGMAGLLLVQAQMCAWAGRAEMGLATVDRAQAWVKRTGMRATLAEIWRMRGELLLSVKAPPQSPPLWQGGGKVGEAEACFHRALEVARAQGARWLELRAAVSLARLWQAQGRPEEARELLTGIYGWFAEGFDTVDLVEARALLEDLQ
jgi:hypothetical protein